MEPEAYMTDGGPVKNRFTACRRLYWGLLWPLAAGYLRRGCPGLLYPQPPPGRLACRIQRPPPSQAVGRFRQKRGQGTTS